VPRLQPQPGYITSKEAQKMLNISDSTLSDYVKRGWLKRYGPPGRTYKFYKLSEVEALVASRLHFDEYQESLPTSFEVAQMEDIPAIVDMDNRTFVDEKENPDYHGMDTSIYSRWLRANPETFYVLRDATRRLVGYACLLPLARERMDQFVRGEIGMEDITSSDVQPYVPGRILHLYVIALAIEPSFRQAVKHEYGARLVRGIFTCLLEMAHRGIEIETITARTFKPDGIRLMRKMGMSWLRSPVAHKLLFRVTLPESGSPVFIRYSEVLTEWKRKHSSVEVEERTT